MAALFGPSEQDLERLRSTVQSLGTTSVPGLAAALSWRERKAERILAHELGRPGTSVLYDPGRRLVRWAHPPALSAEPPAAPTAPSPSPFTTRLPPATGPVLTPAGLKTLCPSCHVPLQATGSGSLAVCPQCGRLSSARMRAMSAASGPTTTAAAASPPPLPTPRPTATPPSPSSASSLTDRRSQELFAAWVTARPIPCPKCKTPLRHRGVSEYVCPGCGQTVRFSSPAPATPAATRPS
jgi:uncharacterized Zn finger protein (UPF0148 family)